MNAEIRQELRSIASTLDDLSLSLNDGTVGQCAERITALLTGTETPRDDAQTPGDPAAQAASVEYEIWARSHATGARFNYFEDITYDRCDEAQDTADRLTGRVRAMPLGGTGLDFFLRKVTREDMP